MTYMPNPNPDDIGFYNTEAPPHKKVLVIKLGALGDFVQALGPMAAIRRHHPHADITLLTTSAFVSFGQACGYVDRVWTDTRPKWFEWREWRDMRRRLIKAGFDRVYDLQNSDRTAFYLNMLPKAKRPEWVGAAPGASIRNNSPERTKGPALEGHIQTLAMAGIHDIELDDLRWVRGSIEPFKLKKPYVLIAPGSAPNHLHKRWPAENYAELARLLHDQGFQPALIGTQPEADIAEIICGITPQAVNLTGQTALSDIVVLARYAAGAIGNDTGPMHLIGPTGCPTAVLFSRHTNPKKHAPRGEAVTTIVEPDLKNLTPAAVAARLDKDWFRI